MARDIKLSVQAGFGPQVKVEVSTPVPRVEVLTPILGLQAISSTSVGVTITREAI